MVRKGHLAALVAAGALLLAGCGSDDGDDAQAAPAGEATAVAEDTSEGRQLSAAELEGALLTLDDLPSGYTKEPVEDEEDSETIADNPECQKILDDLEAKSDATDDNPQAEAAYSQGQLGPWLEHTVKSYEGDQAAEGVDRIRSGLAECPAWTSTDADGTEVAVAFNDISFPDLGDDTYAVRMTTGVEDIEIVANVVMTRVGKNVSVLIHGGLTVDNAETEDLARMATEKLERATT